MRCLNCKRDGIPLSVKLCSQCIETLLPNPQADRLRQNFVEDNLLSERGVDYQKLQQLLKAGKWKEADDETYSVMLKAIGKNQGDFIQREELDKIPLIDLRTIDDLWVKYSRGRFGFSVQKDIYEKLDGTKEFNNKIWIEFNNRVGWRRENKWLSYDDFIFNLSASKGHLPSPKETPPIFTKTQEIIYKHYPIYHYFLPKDKYYLPREKRFSFRIHLFTRIQILQTDRDNYIRKKSEAEAEKSKQEKTKSFPQLQVRKNEIQQVCHKRGIATCIHFTYIQNLESILEEGLLSRDLLEARVGKLKPKYNDLHRFDDCRNAISLSISFPNYRMFYTYSSKNQSDWVILLLDASVLWNLDCAFCQDNAAANVVKRVPLATRKQINSFYMMFEDYEQIRRKDLDIPESYTTNPQAEVLIFDSISPYYIKQVHFYSQEALSKWLNFDQDIHNKYKNILCNDETFFVSSQKYFKYRQDFKTWKKFSENSFMNLHKSELIL